MFNYRVTKQDTAMKLRNMQRKMLKKAIKGVKKGALPFSIEQVESVGGGKTVIMERIALEHGSSFIIKHGESAVEAGTRIHSQIERDWSLEPRGPQPQTIRRHIFAEGIDDPGVVYLLPRADRPSLALYAQRIGRIKRITPEQAQAEMEANIQGPSMADLITKGYLVPPPQDVRLAADCLFSKFGFNDGDLLDDLLEDNGYTYDLGEVWGEFGKTELGLSQRLLVKLVDEFLLPSLPIKLEPKICLGIHNPYRCETATAHGESTTPPEVQVCAVTIPNATVLEMAEALKLEILGAQA
jgi:hypothetical protein